MPVNLNKVLDELVRILPPDHVLTTGPNPRPYRISRVTSKEERQQKKIDKYVMLDPGASQNQVTVICNTSYDVTMAAQKLMRAILGAEIEDTSAIPGSAQSIVLDELVKTIREIRADISELKGLKKGEAQLPDGAVVVAGADPEHSARSNDSAATKRRLKKAREVIANPPEGVQPMAESDRGKKQHRSTQAMDPAVRAAKNETYLKMAEELGEEPKWRSEGKLAGWWCNWIKRIYNQRQIQREPVNT